LAVRHDQKQLALGRYDGALVLLDEKTGEIKGQSSPAKPKVPQVQKIAPGAGQRGTWTSVTFHGTDLRHADELVCDILAKNLKVFTAVWPDKDTDKEQGFHFLIDAGTPPGVYPIGLRSPHGASKTLPFIVDAFKLVQEKEPNNSPGTGQFV